VAPAICTNFSPRPDASLCDNNMIALSSEGAGENRKPAIAMAMKKSMMPVPAPSAIRSRVPPSGFSRGAALSNAARKLVEAKWVEGDRQHSAPDQ